MNRELTSHIAENKFRLGSDYNAVEILQKLEASPTMETSGNIFNPKYFLLDDATGVVYRKEQFTQGCELPVELLVRDKRFNKTEIEDMCQAAGLEVVWSRYVQTGNWDISLDPTDAKAKEILLLCRKPVTASCRST